VKRLRPKYFEKILFEEATQLKSKNYCKIKTERLRRLIWCYNKYIFPTTTPELLFRLAKYCGSIKFARPGVWLPEIRTE
jgi:hypothetical protein